jgi:hypothetical protein
MKIRSARSSATVVAAILIVLTAAPVAFGYDGTTPPPAGSAPLTRGGEVLETMDADNYTYVRIQAEDGDVWVAGPRTAVVAGDRVKTPTGVLMKDFHSNSLDRSFDSIYFLDTIEVIGGPNAGAAPGFAFTGHGKSDGETPTERGPIEKPEGGSTIAELFAAREKLAGQAVVVRGRVVKFNAEIMGRNWIHIQDGTGEPGSNDLTVTTDATAELGDVILVRGQATADKDFGSGYTYDLIVEEASIEVE